MISIVIVFLITAASLLQLSGDIIHDNEVKSNFINPVFDGADPWVIKKDHFYYFCYSSGNSITISKSELLTKKGTVKKIWTAPDTGWNCSNIWAPELHFFDGRWYIYYAAGESGPPFIHQKTGVLQSGTSDPFSKYTDMGMLYTGDNPDMKNDNRWAIDMTVFKYRDNLYAIWSGWEEQAATDKTPQHLYIAEMANPYTMKGLRVKLSSPDRSWEIGGPLDLEEGPEILTGKGNLFIVFSCRESWTINYRLGLLMLKDIEGSLLSPSNWEKTGPVFQGPYGTGHCSFTTSPDGTEDWIVYHSKKNIGEGWQRDIRMQPFKWSNDGKPDFGSPVPAGEEIRRPSGEVEIEKRFNN
jgi:GH43 family beta-xylosidase